MKQFNNLIYITANLQTRFKRLQNRQEKAHENSTTFEQFLHEEQKATETQIPEIAKSADFKIENNSDIESFKKRVQEFTTKFIIPPSS